ncbi:GAF and ANTAR domain-containing protein [Mycobacterium sp. SM1]|uniref:GAF and ANTAR domain-containing protein n=1 Tax=Mycobacterium sp. SM1 TaxID=2816243 RepID=UPI001BD0B246|nr:GAF and ANTAR domain-containing protein [Mycobacterium sp. SM1]MBS4727116.1 GAF and ANTAR domain-containing protein [Mycobacterium sp. SM1]
MTGGQPTVATTFVEIVDTLVADFDLVDFLHLVAVRSRGALGVEVVALLVADNHGGLNLIAASTEQDRVLELFSARTAEGPFLDCYRSGHPVSCPDLSIASGRWPRFVPRTLDAGYAGAFAFPMRLRDKVIGAMTLLTATPGDLDEELLAVAQAFTDVAAIGLLQERAMRQRELLTEQLQTALHNRLTIEQAKGILAQRAGVTIPEAFELLRTHAHTRHQKLTDLADAIVRHDPTVADLVSGPGAGVAD